jgi:hypothetical protein
VHGSKQAHTRPHMNGCFAKRYKIRTAAYCSCGRSGLWGLGSDKKCVERVRRTKMPRRRVKQSRSRHLVESPSTTHTSIHVHARNPARMVITGTRNSAKDGQRQPKGTADAQGTAATTALSFPRHRQKLLPQSTPPLRSPRLRSFSDVVADTRCVSRGSPSHPSVTVHSCFFFGERYYCLDC